MMIVFVELEKIYVVMQMKKDVKYFSALCFIKYKNVEKNSLTCHVE